MNQKIKIQEGFIQIPLLIVIIISIVVASTVTTGVVLHKKGKLSPLIANFSQIFKKAEEVDVEPVKQKHEEVKQEFEEAQAKVEEIEAETQKLEKEAEELEQQAETTKDELERTRLLAEAKKAKAEAEKAKAEAEKARAEVERLKKEVEEAKKLAEETREQQEQESQREESTQESSNPTITSISPNEILSNIDINITVNGTNFRPDATLIIGNFYLNTFDIISDRTIIFKYPRGHLAPRAYSITVRNKDGSEITSASIFKIIDAATITQSPPSSQELTTEEIAAKVSPAVVQIKNDKCKAGYYCTGSGMMIDVSGYILTNEHVIRNDDVVEVKLNNGTVVNGSVIGWNQIYDLAIVKISSSNYYVHLGNSDAVVLGQDAIALGYPLSDFPSTITVLEGIIGSKGKTDNYGISYLQTSANIQGGSSGGPLVDRDAKVIGINTLCEKLLGYCLLGYGYAIEINNAKSIISDLKAGVKVSISEPQPEPVPGEEEEEEEEEPIVSGTLTTNLDYGTPNSTNIPVGDYGTTRIVMTKIKLTANNEDINIDYIDLTRTSEGIGSDADIAAVYLYEGTTLLATGVPQASSKYHFDLTNYIISKDTNKVLTVRADFNGRLTGATSGNQNAFDLAVITDLVAIGVSSGATINASAAVFGNDKYLYRSVPTFGVIHPSSTVLSSINDQEIIRIGMTANSTGDIEFTNSRGNFIRFTISGSVGDHVDDLTENFVFKNITDSQILDTINIDVSNAVAGGNTITFDFSDNALSIGAGQSKIIAVEADLGDFEDGGDTIQVSINNTTADFNWSDIHTDSINNNTYFIWLPLNGPSMVKPAT